MLTGMGFVHMITGEFHMLKAVPQAMELPPEVEVAQDRLTFERCLLRGRRQRLEMRFADQRRVVTVLLEHIAHRRHVLRQLHADGPAVMGRRIQPGNDRGPRRRADRVVAIGPVKSRPLGAEPIQRRRLDARVDGAERAEMMLVAGDEQNVGTRCHAAHSLMERDALPSLC